MVAKSWKPKDSLWALVSDGCLPGRCRLKSADKNLEMPGGFALLCSRPAEMGQLLLHCLDDQMILLMDKLLHHLSLRNSGMMIRLQIPRNNGFVSQLFSDPGKKGTLFWEDYF